MKKRFDRYFGNNLGRKFYIASLSVLAVGVLIGYLMWWGYGMPFIAVGVIGFLVSSGFQVSDKDVDEHIQNELEEFKKTIDGRVIGKETLDARDFSYFYGFIREDAQTRFKAGSDGRVRTSRFYFTAISAKPKNAMVFAATYDLLSDDKPNSEFISTHAAHSIDLATEMLDFPAGNKKCRLKVGLGEERADVLTFFVPNDALADKLLDTIVQR